VFAFVAWHLTFLTFRNSVALWSPEPIPWSERQPWKRLQIDKFDRATAVYGNVLGIEQRWRMFGSLPRARSFPAVRIDFADGSSAVVRAESEPGLPRYLRIGGCRQRKMEIYLASWTAEEDARGDETLLWANYARRAFRRWKAEAGEGSREPVRLVVLRRRLEHLPPGATEREPAQVTEIVAFTPDGRLLP